MKKLFFVCGLFLLGWSAAGALAEPPSHQPHDIQILWAGLDGLVYIDLPLAQEQEKETHTFFYHELRTSDPNTMLVLLNEADCRQKGMMRTHQMGLFDLQTGQITNSNNTNVLAQNPWKNDAERGSLKEMIWNNVCKPETRKPQGRLEPTPMTEIVQSYLERVKEETLKSSDSKTEKP